MIKNLLTAAAFALLAASSAAAQQTVFIGETGYDNIAAAFTAANDGDVITVKGNQTVSSRINFRAEKSVTVKGEGSNISLVRADGYKNGLILVDTKATVSFENLTIDGANVAEVSNKPVEIGNTATAVSFTDCKIVNFNNADRAIHAAKATTITNLTEANSTFTNGTVYVGAANALTVAGTNNEYSIRYDRLSWPIKGSEGLAGKIMLNLPTYEAGATVVNNCTAADAFVLGNAPEGGNFALKAQDGKIVLVSETPIVRNETTGETYASFNEAYAAAVNGDVLVLLENITLADRFLFGTNGVTIKGVNPDITITRGNFTNKLFLGANQNTTLEDLVLDCNNQPNNNYEFQAGTNTFTLKNVKILNSKAEKGLFDVKDTNRTLNLTDVTKENCSSATPDINLVGKLVLSGNTNLSVNVTFNPGTITVGGELTNEEPIEITLSTLPEIGTTIVSGTTDYNKFALTNDGSYLAVGEDNNLVLSDKNVTGIEDVTVENAPVEYYNLSGMRVNGDSLTPGVYVKRQGAKTVKVYVK
ncbi:MAG: hypothetical protein K2L27_00470 [Muribaculaceae bacterium]|nr:hypothetical protein [Muribaculaceae bacterium]